MAFRSHKKSQLLSLYDVIFLIITVLLFTFVCNRYSVFVITFPFSQPMFRIVHSVHSIKFEIKALYIIIHSSKNIN